MHVEKVPGEVEKKTEHICELSGNAEKQGAENKRRVEQNKTETKPRPFKRINRVAKESGEGAGISTEIGIRKRGLDGTDDMDVDGEKRRGDWIG